MLREKQNQPGRDSDVSPKTPLHEVAMVLITLAGGLDTCAVLAE